MILSFVGGLVNDQTQWLSNTAKKFSEVSDKISIELHEEDEWIKNLNLQSLEKKELEKKIKDFCEFSFGLHIPWEPKSYYRLIDKDFDDSRILSWLKFCVDNDIGSVNMHIEWGDGVNTKEWRDDASVRAENIEIAARNLNDIISFVEINGIKLSLETLPSCLLVEKYGEEHVSFPVFPTDYLKLQKLTGFKFGINPDVSHAGITWNNMQNNIFSGVYKEDEEWKGLTIKKFIEKFVKMSKPMHQMHIADFLGYKDPSQHAITLGKGLLTDEGIKAALKNRNKKSVLVLEIKEDWDTRNEIKSTGYFPRAVKSLDKLREFIQ